MIEQKGHYHEFMSRSEVAGIVVTLLLFLVVAAVSIWQVSNGLGGVPVRR